MTRARWIGLGFGLLLIAIAFVLVVWQGTNMPVTNVALAQGAATATPAATSTPAPSSQTQQSIGHTFWTLLAGKLGVNVEDLKAKALEARKEMIDQAVKDGRATQAQADRIKQGLTADAIIAPIYLGPTRLAPQPIPLVPFGVDRWVWPWFFPGRGFWGGFDALGALESVAQALKLTPAQLVTQLSSGKTLAEIAKEQGVDEATVKQAIINAATAQVDKLLQYGLISNAQAEQLKAQLTPDNIDLTRPLWFHFPWRGGKQSLVPRLEKGKLFGLVPGQPFPFFEVDLGLIPNDVLDALEVTLQTQ